MRRHATISDYPLEAYSPAEQDGLTWKLLWFILELNLLIGGANIGREYGLAWVTFCGGSFSFGFSFLSRTAREAVII